MKGRRLLNRREALQLAGFSILGHAAASIGSPHRILTAGRSAAKWNCVHCQDTRHNADRCSGSKPDCRPRKDAIEHSSGKNEIAVQERLRGAGGRGMEFVGCVNEAEARAEGADDGVGVVALDRKPAAFWWAAE